MRQHDETPAAVRWARLRFSIIGSLLASPASSGELKARIEELAARSWRHPTTGEPTRFSFKAIEHWYYAARKQTDPIVALARKTPKHAGSHPSVSAAVGEALACQHRDHPRWSFQLHYDNLVALAREAPSLLPLPGYATVRRYMKAHALLRAKKKRHHRDSGREHCGLDGDFVQRETRSYEVEHVHGLWHLDFHQGSRAILRPSGEWAKPQALGVLDDRSRLCCHLQWYFEETAEALIHALCQAFQKRGLPRALLTDNGGAMLAAETVEGLERLSIVHHTTLPYSPEQNGKQESFWGRSKGDCRNARGSALSLEFLNKATAWVEGDYQREHSEIETPLVRYLRGPTKASASRGTSTRVSYRVSRTSDARRHLPWRSPIRAPCVSHTAPPSHSARTLGS